MAIIRGDIPTDGYTVVDNLWLRDRRLSYKAKGILAAIASHAAGYRLSTTQLIDESADGRDAVRTGLAELEKFGYLERIELREGGRVSGYDFVLTAGPSEGDGGFTGDGKPVTGDDQGKRATDDQQGDGFTVAGKPVTGPDQEEQGVSAGHTVTGFSGDGKSPPEKTISKKTKKTIHSPSGSGAPAHTRTRATRLPADFTINDGMWAWAIDQATTAMQKTPNEATFRDFLEFQTDKFRDHWKASSGRNATKLDWEAAWRNWMRDEITKVAQHGPTAPGTAIARYGGNQPQARLSTGDRRKLEAQAALARVKGEDP